MVALIDLCLCCWMCHQLDDWVLCRIYKKKSMGRSMETREDYPIAQINNMTTPKDDDSNEIEQEEVMKFPRTCSLTNLLEMDYLGPISNMLSDESYNSTFDFQINTAHIGGIDPTLLMPTTTNNPYAADSSKYHVKQQQNGAVNNNPTIFVNPIFDRRE